MALAPTAARQQTGGVSGNGLEEGRIEAVIDRVALDDLVRHLQALGYEVIGPTIRDSAIALDPIESVDELPIGWTEEQEAATYRLVRRDDQAVFGFAAGPSTWKERLFPPRLRLWRAERDGNGFELIDDRDDVRPMAFLGVRACDLHAIGIQGRVFDGGEHPDPAYGRRRAASIVVAVNCSDPGGTCFCVSMGTGPRAEGHFDLALTELLDDEGHRFLVEVGSPAGAAVLDAIPHRDPSEHDRALSAQVTAGAEARMGRSMDTHRIRDLLAENLEHPRWDDVAERCLTCGNCTMVCPTCFCSTTEDRTDLTGDLADRWRRWDSCFTVDHSWLHGGAVRPTARSRYRQWLTHKLGTWWDQFGSSGCVGCGRCITWCPVGIDLTEEVRAIRADPVAVPVPYPTLRTPTIAGG
jgi:sulfhydrogenase subunit beta (sulfur reductase)